MSLAQILNRVTTILWIVTAVISVINIPLAAAKGEGQGFAIVLAVFVVGSCVLRFVAYRESREEE